MARIAKRRIEALLQLGLSAQTTTEQGRALEDLACYVFGTIPGTGNFVRNQLNAFQTEEVDVAFWNDRAPDGLHFLPNVVIVECKNWSGPIGSVEVAYFANRLLNRGRDHGVLLAANGITGTPEHLTRAHYELAMALSRGINIIVLTGEEVRALRSSEALITLLKQKLCELAVAGTIY